MCGETLGNRDLRERGRTARSRHRVCSSGDHGWGGGRCRDRCDLLCCPSLGTVPAAACVTEIQMDRAPHMRALVRPAIARARHGSSEEHARAAEEHARCIAGTRKKGQAAGGSR